MTNDLTVKSAPVALPVSMQEAVEGLIGDSLSASTARAYRSDLAAFIAWCGQHDLAPVPSSPEVICSYIGHMAEAGKRASSISRAIAAISCAHELKRVERNPCRDDLVKRALKGMRRRVGTAQEKKAPATASRVAAMLETLPDTLKGKRDRALLALGFAGAFRRSELVALDMSDIEAVEGGARVTIRKSKTDQTGEGQVIGIVDGVRLRPLAAVAEWVRAAGITSGPIFRSVDRHGNVSDAAMCDRQVARLVKDTAEAAGLDPEAFSGHSLRAGFITSAAASGCDALRIAETSRHKNMDILRGYVRTENLTKNYAGAAFM
ncbi:tyrosine-type recombinase/integrase [Acetobacter sp.]|uniref:tyrosine-type recombinase/integrase n=1 Tax=Acetobacter sp. TaxID=440 RepID=UPI0039EC17CE